MQQTEYLNEERYQKSNAKVKKVGKILLIVGIVTLVVSFILLIVGFVGAGNSAMDGFNSMSNEMIDNFNSFGNGNNGINIDVSGMQDTTSGIFGNIGLFAIGSFMLTIGFGLTIAGGIVMFIAHRREITAYTTQQVMPVAQEGIQKMAPTVGSAMGTIGKELAKGIREGINEADKQNND
ncbi:MAG: hypothetical protein ACI4WP_00365 [Bacilli bacterium]